MATPKRPTKGLKVHGVNGTIRRRRRNAQDRLRKRLAGK